ncbi:hypothetical protein EUA93_15985 [Nocardioides oleivorans]|uniref:DUF732 domain-containing protein n=1 Tax=Nocardioides oleivorans TaxID=273676 RepID=A0A4Q2RRU6_9ACTN|nr:hypothetical protein [Nocardioides oleivorans]RYB91657.1 hypothetical protein EUA93_15985 [Nocardioides oleivorans]
MGTRRAGAAAATLLLAALGACGGSGEPDVSEPVESAISAAPSDIDDATSADSDLDGEADPGLALSPDRLCGFLTEQTPRIADLQPAEYAAATFGSALFAFYSEQGLLTDIDGADIDSLTAEGCPAEATALLAMLGARSFKELLSQ